MNGKQKKFDKDSVLGRLEKTFDRSVMRIDMFIFRGLLLYTVVAIFHIEWCTRKPLSSSVILNDNTSIAQHH